MINILEGEQSPSPKRYLELLKTNEVAEFLVYFPEYKEEYENFKKQYTLYVREIDKLIDKFVQLKAKGLSRKDFAEEAKKTIAPSFMFGLLDGKWGSTMEYINSLNINSLLNSIEGVNK